MKKFKKTGGWMLLGSILLIGAIYSIVELPKLLPVKEEALSLAMVGVAENKLWEPVIRRIDGVEMVLVPAGCFMMGSTDEQLQEANRGCDAYFGTCQQDFENEQPAHEVCISSPYWFDLTAVTNAQYGASSDKGTDISPDRDRDWPRETVTWQEAADFCVGRGGRLPTEAEWEFAARGPDLLIYPFGDEYDIYKVTLQKVSPVAVGQKPDGASWVGALDMSGGIAEWVEDWYGPYPVNSMLDPVGPAQGELKITRGGSWFVHASYFVRTTWREPFAPGYATSVVGFRCMIEITP